MRLLCSCPLAACGDEAEQAIRAVPAPILKAEDGGEQGRSEFAPMLRGA